MTNNPDSIRDFHAHIYYNPDELELARDLGEDVRARFGEAATIEITIDP